MAIGINSCSKQAVPSNLALLQHKWSIISFSGEALHYSGVAGDYWNFDVSGISYIYHGGRYDTANYAMKVGGKTIIIYPIQQGIQATTPLVLNISSLTATSLVMAGSAGSGINILDSLNR